jgi:hypothetical protein
VPPQRSGSSTSGTPSSRFSNSCKRPSWIIPRAPPPSRLKMTGPLVGGRRRTVSVLLSPQMGHWGISVWYSAKELLVPKITTQLSQIVCLHDSICSGRRHMQRKQIFVDRSPAHFWKNWLTAFRRAAAAVVIVVRLANPRINWSWIRLQSTFG